MGSIRIIQSFSVSCLKLIGVVSKNAFLFGLLGIFVLSGYSQTLVPDNAYKHYFQNNSQVNAVVELSDGSLLVGGEFEYFDSTFHEPYLARVRTDGTIDGVSSAALNRPVRDIQTDGSGRIVILGEFFSVNGVAHDYLIRLNSDLSLDVTFMSNVGTATYETPGVMKVDSSGSVFVGGRFNDFNGTSADGLVKLDSTGQLDSGFTIPVIENSHYTNTYYRVVTAIDIDATGKVLIGGNFTDVNGVTRNGLARLNTDGSLDTTFDPGGGLGKFDMVYGLKALASGKVLVAGSFTSFDSTAVNGFIRLEADGSLDAAFTEYPVSGGGTNLKELADGTLVTHGRFTEYFDGTSAQNLTGLAFLNADGTLSSSQHTFAWEEWDALNAPSREVHDVISKSGGGYVLAGAFLTGPAVESRGLVELDSAGDLSQGWTVWKQANYVEAIARAGDGSLFIGGRFSYADGVLCQGLIKLKPDGSIDTNFIFDLQNEFFFAPPSEVRTIVNAGSHIYVGGFLEYVVTQNEDPTPIAELKGVLRLDAETGEVDTTFQFSAQSSVSYLFLLSDGTVLVSGYDVDSEQSGQQKLAHVDSTGTILRAWDVSDGPRSSTNMIAELPSGKLLIGGFSNVQAGDSAWGHVVRLDSNLDVDSSFDPGDGPSWPVRSILATPDGGAYLAGGFTSYDNEPVWKVVKIDATGALDSSFTPPADMLGNTEWAVVDPAGRLLLAGSIYTAGGYSLPGVVRLHPDGSLDETVFAGSQWGGGTIYDAVLDGTELDMVGSFDEFDSVRFPGYVRFAAPVGAPVIITQPEGDLVASEDDVSFSVVATGDPVLQYQWYKDDVALTGENSSTLQLLDVDAQDQGVYFVAVSNDEGLTESQWAELFVDPWPAILQQPSGYSVYAGDDFSLNVSATGAAPLAYQWYAGVSGNTSSPIQDATDVILQRTAGGSGSEQYWVQVSNTYGVVNSDTVTVTVEELSSPFISSGLSDTSVDYGSPINLSVSASGSGNLFYAWFLNGAPLPETSSSLAIASTDQSHEGTYRVEVTSDRFDPSVYVAFSEGDLDVRTFPEFTAQPQSQTVAQGDDLTLSSTVAGPGPLTFQWQKLDGSWLNIDGANTSTLQITDVGLEDSGDYRLRVVNSFGTVFSSVATISVNAPPQITFSPTSRALPTGESTTLSVTAVGSPSLSYQWYQASSGNEVNPVGGNSNVLDTGALAETTQFWVKISNSFGSVNSVTANISVGDPPVASVSPASLTLNQGQTAVFSAQVAGDGPFLYQWKKDGLSLFGRTGSSLTISNVTEANDAGGYSVSVVSNYGNDESAPALLAVITPPSISSQPINRQVPEGGTTNFTVVASGTAPFNYQWFFNNGPIADSDTATLVVGEVELDDAGEYKVQVSNPAGSVTSAVATLGVDKLPEILLQPTPQSYVATGSAASLSVSADGAVPLAYQWYEGVSPDTSFPVGSNSPNFTSPVLNSSTSFWVRVTNIAGSVNSSTATVTVGDPPSFTAHPQDEELEVGGAFTLDASVAGSAPFTYQWKKNGINLAGATSNQLSVNPADFTDAGDYTVLVSNQFGSELSDAATVTVIALTPPSITSQPVGRTLGVGDNVTFSVSATGSIPLGYQWFRGELAISGATSSSYQLDPLDLSDAGEYWCRVTNDAGSDDSERATLIVLSPPSINSMLERTIAAGLSTTVAVSATGAAPLSYQWYQGSLGDESNPVGTNSSTLSTGILNATTIFWVKVTNSVGEAQDSTTVTVLEPVAITSQPQSQTVNSGVTVTFSVTATGGGTLNYQWFLDGEIIEGETSANLSFAAGLADSGVYAVQVNNGVSSEESQQVELTVQTPPFITQELTDATYSTGSQAVFSVTADGSPTLQYAWYLNDMLIPGESGSTLTLNSVSVQDTGNYKVVVSNAFGSEESSAILTVEGAPVITNVSAPESADYDTTANLSATVAGPGPLSYAWFQGALGDTSTPVGSNQSTLITPVLRDTASFWLRVTNSFGSDDSNEVEISVEQPIPVITSGGTATASVGSAFTYQVTATNSPTSFSASPLPAGLDFNAVTGILSGAPASEGVYAIELEAYRDALVGEKQMQLTVNPPKPVHVGFEEVTGQTDSTLTLDLNILNPVESVQLANLPAWLTYDSINGQVTGSTNIPGEYSFQILLTNAGGTTTQTITFIVNPADLPQIISDDFAVARQGEVFSFTFETDEFASGFELVGNIPDGVSWNAFTGQLSGIPLVSGVFDFEVNAENSLGSGAVQQFTLDVAPGIGLPKVTNLSEVRGYIDEVFELILEASDAPDSFEALSLPQGITLSQDGATGQWKLLGQPLFTGVTLSRVRGVNFLGAGKWKEISIDIRPGRVMPVISSGAVAEGRETVPFNFQLTATESPTGFNASGLPTGLSLDESSGLISGTPSAPGTYTVSVSAENIDGTGPVLNMVFDIDVEPGTPVIQTFPTFVAQQSVPYSASIFSTESPIRFSALSDLPPGITLIESTGRIVGTPTAKGTYEFIVESESGFGFVSEPTTLTMQILGPPGTPNVTSATEIEGTVDEAFAYSLTADAAYGSAQIGELPPGLSFANNNITGTPTLAGEFEVPVLLSNTSGSGVQAVLTFNILPGSATPRISNLSAVELNYAELFDLQVSAINGPITAWKFENLPPGLDYDATTGEISGRAARVGVFDARLSARNDNGFGPSQLVKFIVKADPAAPVITSPTYLHGWQNQEMGYLIQATNMPVERPLPSGYRFRAIGLPSGFTLDPSRGIITGIPQSGFDTTVTVWAETPDGNGNPRQVRFRANSYNPAFKLSRPGFVSGPVSQPLSVVLQANQSIISSFVLESSSLLNVVPPVENGPTVIINPVRTGSVYLRFYGVSTWSSDWIETLVHILPGPQNANITSPSEYYVVAGETISIPLSVSDNGDYPKLIGPLPSGLSFDWFYEVVSGNLDTPGTYSFRVAAYNEYGLGAPKDIRIYVAPAAAAPVINAVNEEVAEPQALVFAESRSFTLDEKSEPVSSRSSVLTVSGTAGIFLSVSISAGSEILEYRAEGLPDGLIMNEASGLISGIPTNPGMVTALVSARNTSGWGAASEVQFEIGAAAGTPVVTSADSLNAQVGVAFNHTVTSSPSAASYNIIGPEPGFTVDAGAGTITGTFDTAGEYEWEISGNNEHGQGYVQLLTITVAPAGGTPVVANLGSVSGNAGTSMSVSLSASGSPTYWDVESLPYGLSIDNATGEITGTPLEAGESTHLVRAENASGFGAAVEMHFIIEASLSSPEMTSASNFSVREGEVFTFQLEASNAPDGFGSTALPEGVTLNPTTGALSGIPVTEGSYSISLLASNEHGEGPTQDFTLYVQPPLQSFDDWVLDLPEGERGPLDDPFDHGISNILKFALGITFDSTDRSHLPTFGITDEGDQTYLSITFTRSTEVEGVTFGLRGGADLSGLSPVASESELIGTPAPGLERVRLKQSTPIDGEERWFLQLEVNQD